MIRDRKPRFFYGNIVVIASLFILLAMWGVSYSFGVFFEPLLTEFGWTRAATSGAFSLSIFLSGFAAIGMGRLSDRVGPRRVLTIAGILFGLGYLLMSRVSAIWQIYLFYGIAAIGLAGGYVPLTSTVSRWFVERRGTMTGIVVSGIAVGTMIMPLVANHLISTYEWRTAYVIIGIIVLLIVVSAAQFLRRDPSQMGLSSYGTKDGEEVSLQASGISLREAMRTGQFWMLLGVFFCFFFGVSTIMAHVVIHARGLGISPTGAALILTVIGGVGVGGRIMMGRAADRIGNKLAIVISVILIAASFFLLLGAKEAWMFYLFAALLGVGYGAEAALLSPMVAEYFGLSSLGGILGAMALGTQTGGAIGPVLAGRIYDVYGSYYLAFLICAVLSIVALILALRLKPVAGKGGTDDSKRGT